MPSLRGAAEISLVRSLFGNHPIYKNSVDPVINMKMTHIYVYLFIYKCVYRCKHLTGSCVLHCSHLLKLSLVLLPLNIFLSCFPYLKCFFILLGCTNFHKLPFFSSAPFSSLFAYLFFLPHALLPSFENPLLFLFSPPSMWPSASRKCSVRH